MGQKVRSFNKWSQGSSASMDPALGEYNSKNAQVYENGTLGPRPGWKELAQSNQTHVFTDTPAGVTWYVGSDEVPHIFVTYWDSSAAAGRQAELITTTGAWTNDILSLHFNNTNNLAPKRYPDTWKMQTDFDGIKVITSGGGIYLAGAANVGTGVWPVPAAAEVTVDTSSTVFEVDDISYFAAGDTIYIYDYEGTYRYSKIIDSIDVAAKEITITVAGASIIVGDLIQTTNSINDDGWPRAATIYRERAYYWGYSAAPGRVYYSEPADYSRVPILNFFDVSIAASEAGVGVITSMFAVKNALMIGREDNRWMVLTGTSPENGTLRELGTDPVPDWQTGAIVDNAVYYLNPAGQGVGIATPSAIETKELSYMSPTAYPDSTELRPDPLFMPAKGVGDDVTGNLFLPGRTVGDNNTIMAVERANDVFNLSVWEHDTTDADNIFFTGGWPGELWAIMDDGAEFRSYSRNVTLNRPARSADTLSLALSVEDGVTTGEGAVVRLGETVAGEGKIIRPTKVVVDLDYWKGGTYEDPSLLVDGTVMGTEAAASQDAFAQQTVTTTAWGDTTANLPYKRRVAVALPNTQFGTRFEITLTFESLALDTVQVYYEEQDDPR